MIQKNPKNKIFRIKGWLLQNKFIASLIVLHIYGYWMVLSSGAESRWTILSINIAIWVVVLGLPAVIWKQRLYDFYLREYNLVGFWLLLISFLNATLSSDFLGNWKAVAVSGGGWASVFLIAYFVGRYRQDSAPVKWFGRVFFGILALLIAALIITKFLLAAK